VVIRGPTPSRPPVRFRHPPEITFDRRGRDGRRIIAVCDAFDAMVSDRPYQARKTVEAALAELERCAGGQVDPSVVAAFSEAVRSGETLSRVATAA